jgi:geranylgeranyl pyrophosphate synthase
LSTPQPAGSPTTGAAGPAGGPATGTVRPAGSAVDAVLVAALGDVPAALRDPCRRIALAGGKRLRAGLVLAVADGADRAVPAAAAVELLHLATLVHDDLLDDAPVRRGVPTINAKEGTATALLAGDVLIGLAGRLAAGVGGGCGALLGEALIDLCAGQAREADHRFRADVTAGAVLDTAALKTGTLLATACELGARLSGRHDPDALRRYGLAFGTCLQLLDDLLDVLSDDETYGKPTGADFPAGVVTLPAVHGMAADPELRALLRPGLTAEERRRAGDLLRAGPGVPATVAEITRTTERAAGAAGGAPELAVLPRRYADRQLALVLPRHRHLLG